LERNLFLADVGENEGTHVCRRFVFEDFIADILRQLLMQNPYTACISVCSSQEKDMFTVTAHLTVITARNDCSVCYLKHYGLVA